MNWNKLWGGAIGLKVKGEFAGRIGLSSDLFLSQVVKVAYSSKSPFPHQFIPRKAPQMKKGQRHADPSIDPTLII
jgi:hypothetical protein